MSTTPSPITETTASLPTLQTPRYHPDFTDSSGMNTDVTLVARDGLHFRINATALRLASGVFETTLSLPQCVETEWKEPVINSLDEDSEVLEDLLRIISGREILPKRLISLDSLQPRLLAAEKWDMRGVLSIMRALLCTNPDVSSHPMSVYQLGSHFGWKDVTSAASKYTCHNDLFRDDQQSLLGQVVATDLLGLMNFHKARKDRMKTHLFGDVTSFHTTPVIRCSKIVLSADYQNFAWRVLEEMDYISPACKISGDKLQTFSEEAHMNECRCRTCNVTFRSRQDIIKQVQSDWAALPETLTVWCAVQSHVNPDFR